MKSPVHSLLEIEQLSLRVQDRWLVRKLSFTVSPGEFIAIIGSSGSGKTTLLRSISGEIEPFEGQISKEEDSRLLFGSIPQDLQLAEASTVFKNALSGCLHRYNSFETLLGFPEKEKKQALELLEELGLARKLGQWTSTLSRGERQRLSIARAMLASPMVMLADEPVASLDEEWAFKVINLLKQHARQSQSSILCSLHDRKQVERHADRVLRIDPSGNGDWTLEELTG